MVDQNVICTDAVVTLKKGEGRFFKAGGSWIYDNEIASVMGHTDPGDILKVQDFDGFFLGYGMYNPHSKIRIRMISRWNKEKPELDFLKTRVRSAWEYRKAIMDAEAAGPSGAGRIIFGEADFLPGLTVDRYADLLVVQSMSFGLDRWKMSLLETLKECMAKDGIVIRGIYERSDAAVRKKEGMQPYKGWLEIPEGFEKNPEEAPVTVEIVENGIRYLVDVEQGQKTGFFLDQKENRQAIRRLCKDRLVLDCFTNMGTFALNAAAAGAREVIGLDISETAVRQASENAKRNHLDKIARFEVRNVMEYLPELEKADDQYDVVILDPPAFTKSRETIKRALKGYREINRCGMKLVKDGGFLITCSCSHFVTPAMFEQMLKESARLAHKRLRQVEARAQAPDHPILWDNAEGNSSYLKFYMFQVVDEK